MPATSPACCPTLISAEQIGMDLSAHATDGVVAIPAATTTAAGVLVKPASISASELDVWRQIPCLAESPGMLQPFAPQGSALFAWLLLLESIKLLSDPIHSLSRLSLEQFDLEGRQGSGPTCGGRHPPG